jgi:hypothetical protein
VSDRLVREIGTDSAEPPRPFSSYLEHRNLILLGDPGAGKTHLFRHFAGSSPPLRTRDFLTRDLDSLRARKTLFVDGIDEKRSGRGEQSTVDAIVQRLWDIKPSQVRLSCREQDWLGESDLAAFRPYFEHAGGFTVLRLERLTAAEQISVLTEHHIPNPEAFLHEAIRRGLNDLLTNPQNLLMLAEVVTKKSWPRTRGELFRSAVEVLLTEHNRAHTDHKTGSYSPTELLEPAGAACAARLIADVDGISLANSSTDESIPSYRTIHVTEPDRVLAALQRRVFTASGTPETVDYIHRTVAEYLAADYLTRRARAGLPLGRICALIGVDGKPASELRGLHAWLAVLLPERATALIDADPFGVLSYGDAASLPKGNREHLMWALAQLSETDPWFRSKDWSASASLGALSGPDMTETFRTILRGTAARYVLRSVVLDALSVGAPIPELVDELVHILLSPTAPYSERDGALDALLNTPPAGPAAVAREYPNLGSSTDDLRVRAQILQRLRDTQSPLSGEHVAVLLHDALQAQQELPGGTFWQLSAAVLDDDALGVLTKWSSNVPEVPDTDARQNTSEVLVVIDDLLIRLLDPGQVIDNRILYTVLKQRRKLNRHYTYGRAERVQKAFIANTATLTTLVSLGVVELLDGGRSWALQSDLSRLLAGAADDTQVLRELLSILPTINDDSKREVAYEAAMGCCFRIGESASGTYLHLLAYADTLPSLHNMRDTCSFWIIPDWRTEQTAERLKHAEKRHTRIKEARAEFETEKTAIRNGTQLGWLAWIAEVYFSRYTDFDAQTTPNRRLVTEFGEENAAIAVEGLIALVLGGHISTLDEVIDLHLRDRWYRWWLAIVAGLDEYSESGRSVADLPDSYLTSALAIDLLHPTYRQERNVSNEAAHPWKDWLIRERPQLAIKAYVAIARSDLHRNAQFTNGLSMLTRTTEFAPYRADVAASLLQAFPAAPSYVLSDLLPLAREGSTRERLRELIQTGLVKCEASGNHESYAQWLTSGLLLDVDEYRGIAEQLNETDRRRVVWALRNATGYRHSAPAAATFPPDTLEYAISLAARIHQRSESPDSGWSGDTNAWDATRYTLGMIAALSADISEGAVQSLQRLLQDPKTKQFHDDIRHALANQRALRIDATFRQPSWSATLDALGGGPPANIADLHALVVQHLVDLNREISASNTDIYKWFWNENSNRRPTKPKGEESNRDVLVGLLQPRLAPQGVSVEPEGHMARDKRTDIAVLRPRAKVVVELKRHYHSEVWAAITEQLERFYTRDPDAQGYGIYGVFWFGDRRPEPTPKPPTPHKRPRNATEMQSILKSLIPPDKRDKIVTIVIDVSGDS